MRSPVGRVAALGSLAVGSAVVGVLVGLLGMHVLGLHGVLAEPVLGGVAVTSIHRDDASGVHAHGDGRTPANPGESASAPCCDHGHGTDGLMLCLALVVGAGVLAVLIWRNRAGGVARQRLRSGPLRPPRRQQARAGPPYLIAHSVIRC